MSTFITGEQIARVAAQIAAADLGLASLIYRDIAADYRAGGGNTVSIPVPGATTTSTRPVGSTANYDLGSITEQKIDATLTTEAYSVVPISLAESTLEIESFARQVLRPQALTVANHVERAVASAMAATSPEATIAYDAVKPHEAFIRARAVLRGRGVPADRPLVAVVGADVFADLLLAEKIDDQGRVAGIAVRENTMVDPGALYVFVREAFVAALRAPEPPDGATLAASVVEDGMALTSMRVLNGANGVTNSIVTTFVGVAPLPLPVADYETGAVDLVPGGGIVSVNTAAA